MELAKRPPETTGPAGNTIYYFEVGEGRWSGDFDFRITDFGRFFAAPLGVVNHALGLVLHAASRLPGAATMHGHIHGDAGLGEAGVVWVDVCVRRFGMEVYKLDGRYALAADGVGVDIVIEERIGPRGIGIRRRKPARGEITEDGMAAMYAMPILGQDWIGHYRIKPDRDRLVAEYACPWGTSRERMRRVGRSTLPRRASLPDDAQRQRRVDALAVTLEGRARALDHDRDKRAVFVTAYARMLRALGETMVTLSFDDPDWVVALAELLATRFDQALVAAAPPRPWATIFDLLQSPRTVVETFALCAVAHIGADLPRALHDVGTRRSDGTSAVADYVLVGDALADATDTMLAELRRQYGGELSLAGLRASTWLQRAGHLATRSGRMVAWANADRLAQPRDRASVEDDLDDAVERWARRIAAPSRWTLRRAAGVARMLGAALWRTPARPLPPEDPKR